ncbi:MAG: hypothetical protein EBU66_16460 [Bacteroidetes bacterium]|nr:hypothetical protein [Bacteroidota bacterium]
MDNFFAVVWGIIFIVGGFSMWFFLYHSLHDRMHTEQEQAKTKSKLITGIVLFGMIFLFMYIAFGSNS